MMGNGHKVKHFFLPARASWGSQTLGKVEFLGCQLGWHVPGQNPKDTSLPFPLSPFRRQSNPCQAATPRALLPVGGAALGKAAGGGDSAPGHVWTGWLLRAPPAHGVHQWEGVLGLV